MVNKSTITVQFCIAVTSQVEKRWLKMATVCDTYLKASNLTNRIMGQNHLEAI